MIFQNYLKHLLPQKSILRTKLTYGQSQKMVCCVLYRSLKKKSNTDNSELIINISAVYIKSINPEHKLCDFSTISVSFTQCTQTAKNKSNKALPQIFSTRMQKDLSTTN